MDHLFKALADPNRRKILELLKSGDKSVTELQEDFSITQASLSHHLDILKRSGLVVTERRGQFIFYSLNTTVLQDATRLILNVLNYDN